MTVDRDSRLTGQVITWIGFPEIRNSDGPDSRPLVFNGRLSFCQAKPDLRHLTYVIVTSP